MKIYIASCLICLSSLSTWICIVALKPVSFEQIVCIAYTWRPRIMALWLSRKMKPYKLWQINSNTNRQYLLEDFLEAKASFQTKITREIDESPFLISKPQTSATFS